MLKKYIYVISTHTTLYTFDYIPAVDSPRVNASHCHYFDNTALNYYKITKFLCNIKIVNYLLYYNFSHLKSKLTSSSLEYCQTDPLCFLRTNGQF